MFIIPFCTINLCNCGRPTPTMSPTILVLIYCLVAKTASQGYRHNDSSKKTIPHWRIYINSLIRSGFPTTYHISMSTVSRHLYRSVDVNSRPCQSDSTIAHTYKGYSHVYESRHPCGYSSIVMSTQHRRYQYYLIFDIQVSPDFHLNITFHQFHLLSGLRGCTDEVVSLLWWAAGKRTHSIQCGHRTPWTVLISNYTLKVVYYSYIKDKICENSTVAPSNLFFSYQVVSSRSFSQGHINVPIALSLTKFQTDFTLYADHRFGYGGVHLTPKEHVFYQRYYISGSYPNTVAVNISRTKYTNTHMSFYDGPHKNGFPEIYASSDNVKIQSTGMYLTMQVENRNRKIAHKITFDNTNLIKHVPVHVDISHKSPHKQLILPVDASACQFWQHLVMCAVKISTPVSHFVNLTIPDLHMDIPDYPKKCIYRSLVIWETNRLNITGKNYPLKPVDIDHVSPIIRFCNKLLMKAVSDNILFGDLEKGKTFRTEVMETFTPESCIRQKLPLNTYSSSTNQVTVLYYMYRPYGMSITNFNVTVNILLTTCQGMTFQCHTTFDSTRTQKLIDSKLDMRENALLSLGYMIPTHSAIATKRCYIYPLSTTRYHQVIFIHTIG